MGAACLPIALTFSGSIGPRLYLLSPSISTHLSVFIKIMSAPRVLVLTSWGDFDLFPRTQSWPGSASLLFSPKAKLAAPVLAGGADCGC